MIRFLYDNDVLEHLIDDADYEAARRAVIKSVEEVQSQFYYTQISFLELLKGIRPSNFERLKRIALESYVLSGGGSVLLNPQDHLAYATQQMSQTRYVENVAVMIGDIRSLTKSPDYAAFTANSEARASYLRNWLEATKRESQRSTDYLQEQIESGEESQADLLLSNRSSNEFFQRYTGQILDHFHLGPALARLSVDEIVEKFPSLKYFADVFRVRLLKRLAGKKVQESDYFDLEKVAYLDICDYIVTDDRAFRALFKETGIPDLAERAISLSRLREHLSGKMLKKQPTSRVWDKADKRRVQITG